MNRESLLAALRARLAPESQLSVTGPRAEAETDVLMALTRPFEGALDLEVLHVVGWMYWSRYQLPAPEGGGAKYAGWALTCFAPVFAAKPEAVPEQVEAYFRDRPADAAAGAAGPPARSAPEQRWAGPAQLATACYRLFETTGDPEALATAMASLLEAADAVPPDAPDRVALVTAIGNTLADIATRTGNVQAMDAATTVAETALAAAAATADPLLPACLTNLGNARWRRYGRTGDLNDLSEAVHTHRAAIAALPDDSPDRPMYLSNLAIALQAQADLSGDVPMLREAVAVLREAAATTPSDHPQRVGYLSNLNNALLRLAEATGEESLLGEAEQAIRAATGAGSDQAGQAVFAGNLSATLNSRFRRYGGPSRTEDIATARAAVAALPVGHPHRPKHLNNLSYALLSTFIVGEDSVALLDAAAAMRAAVNETPEGHPDRPMYLGGLSTVLQQVSVRNDDGAALDEALIAARAALGALPETHAGRPKYLNSLGTTLYLRFQRTGDLDELREAVACAHAGLAALPAAHVFRATLAVNSATWHRAYFEHTGNAAAHAEAVAAGRAAVDLTPADHPERCQHLTGYAIVLLSRTSARTASTIALARRCLAEAADSQAAPFAQRITAGRWRAWTDTLAGDHAAALAVMESVVALLPLTASRTLRRADREHRLGASAGLSAQAAAAACAAGDPQRAVELLEQTRGLLLGEAMDRYSDSAVLREHAPDLAEEYDTVLEQLFTLDPAHDDLQYPALDEARQRAEQRGKAVERRTALLDRIRTRPGLAGFALPPTLAELRRQAAHGPVVLVSSDQFRADALVLTADPLRPVLHVPLPGLSYTEAAERAARLRAARAEGIRDILPIVAHNDLDSGPADILDTLAWLWDVVAEPVLAALGLGLGHAGPANPADPWPRLWWCPVGVMAHLPLHAAGHHHESAEGSPNPRTVMDRVISSYTPTIRALAHVRATAPAGSDAAATLIVSVPRPTGARALPGVEAEARALARILPGATCLDGEQATHDQVLADLPRHNVAHFACHGLSDPADPAGSRLILSDHADHPLTVAMLSRLRLAAADLAYLSACSTTDTSLRLADESVHITAAFLLAGYRNVVGTLCPIDDDAATRIAADFYAAALPAGAAAPDTTRSALALHRVMRAQRADRPDRPDVWASYIHAGA